MARKLTKKTTKKPLHHRLKTYNFFLVFAALLGMIAGVLLVRTFYQEALPAKTQSLIQLGVVEYDFSGEKAVKRNDVAITSLKNFLHNEAVRDCNVHDLPPTQYRVIVGNKALDQVLVGYGCGDTIAHKVAVRDGESWKFLSPTNHFDMMGIIECGYADKNKLDEVIAPVCYSAKNDAVTYHTR